MSLASLLFNGGQTTKEIDSGLDAMFKSNVTVKHLTKKKKEKSDHTSSKQTKQAYGQHSEDVKSASPRGKRRADEEHGVSFEQANPKERMKRQKQAETDDVVVDEGNDDLGNDDSLPIATSGSKGSEDQSSDEAGSDDDSTPQHESLMASSSRDVKSRRPSTKIKFVPEDETAEQLNARTVFVGNVSVDVAKNRPLLKQFKKHILSIVPKAKSESVRLRSLPFQKPTSTLEPESAATEGPDGPSTGRHGQDRASAWRVKRTNSSNGEANDQGGNAGDRHKLTPNEKRKIAFIHQNIHADADSVNAYVVFGHPIPAELRRKNLPQIETMDPFEAARTVVREGDGTVFAGKTIRVDLAVKDKKGTTGDGKEAHRTTGMFEPTFTVFVGNLDFATKEEDLRAFFEEIVIAERGDISPGPVQQLEAGHGDDPSKQSKKAWVKRVRVVRDSDTQLGKGFAYVEFLDRECVDEVLALEQGRMKFAKRQLRVQRCAPTRSSGISAGPSKGTSGSRRSTTASGSKTTATELKRRALPYTRATMPKGDPTLGIKLAGLAKEERKQIKATNADRVARRLAKKKARIGLSKKQDAEGDKRKDRNRERKTKSARK